MGDGSTIEWLQRPDTKPASWNPIRAINNISQKVGWHCERVHEGCRWCYAEGQNEAAFRGGTGLPFKPGHRAHVEIYFDEKTLAQPLHWTKPRTIFVCSMSDLYGGWVPDEWIDQIKAVEAATPQHTYIELTKRAARSRDYLSATLRGGAIDHQAGSLASRGVMDWTRAERAAHVADQGPLPNVWNLVSCSE